MHYGGSVIKLKMKPEAFKRRVGPRRRGAPSSRKGYWTPARIHAGEFRSVATLQRSKATQPAARPTAESWIGVGAQLDWRTRSHRIRHSSSRWHTKRFWNAAVTKPIGCFWHEAADRWLLELKFHATCAETELKPFLVCHQMDRHAFGVLHN